MFNFLHRRFDWKRDRMVFTHIPKTAGTSIERGLADVFGEAFWPCRYGIDNDAVPPHGARASAGHFPYGAHPMHRLRPVYVSVLRHPVSRFMSYYRHIQDHPDHYAARSVPDACNMSPLEVAKALREVGNLELCDLQARMLTGQPAPANDIRQIERTYRLIGTVERMDEFSQKLGDLLARTISVPMLNVSKTQVEADAELSAYIEDINPRDMALYRHFSGPT